MEAKTQKIQQAMTAFIEQRLADKLDKEKNEDKRHALRQAHQPATWIANAAGKVAKIQLVTHAIKYSHPDAKGTSLCVDKYSISDKGLIGSHTIKDKGFLDTVCDAKLLPIAAFLCIEVDGTPLWQRARDRDQALLSALPGNAQQNQVWVEAFSSLTNSEGPPASHKLAKQIYWPMDDGSYHLLQPLFPTTLVHQAHAILQEVRSDETKEARKAQREQKPHPQGYRDWPNRVVQKFGGTKPQNISQLNSERHGEVWLLPSVPPQWRQTDLHPPLRVSSFFNRRLPLALRQQAHDLGAFLLAVKDRNNIDIRQARAKRVSAIVDELIEQAMRVQLLPAGWSDCIDCKLPETERYWLDPRFDDEAFQQQRNTTNWPRDIAERFGNWLNAQLRRHKLPVGDPEHRQWRHEFETELENLIREIAHV